MRDVRLNKFRFFSSSKIVPYSKRWRVQRRKTVLLTFFSTLFSSDSLTIMEHIQKTVPATLIYDENGQYYLQTLSKPRKAI